MTPGRRRMARHLLLAALAVLGCCAALAGGPGLSPCLAAEVAAHAAAANPRGGRVPAGGRSSSSAVLLRQARQDFDANRYAAASERLEELLGRVATPGERTEAYVLLCESRLRQGKFALAESLAVNAKTAGNITDKAAFERLGFLKAEIFYFSGDMKKASDEYITFLEEDLQGDLVNDAVERLLLIDENTGPSPQPLTAYARAELAELAGAPDSAIALLDGITRDTPAPLIADDALAKKGDILRGLRRFADAVTQYRLVEARFPQSRLVPECKLKIARIYATDMGQKEKAVAECEEVAKGFPETSYAVEARAMLAELGGGGKKEGK